MQERHILKGEEEGRQQSNFPGKFKFAANKIEHNNAYRAENNREETPPESIIREDVNTILRGVAGDRRTAGAAIDREFIVRKVKAADFHLFLSDSDRVSDGEQGSIRYDDYFVIGITAADHVGDFGPGIMGGGLESVKNVFSCHNEKLSQRRMFGPQLAGAADNRPCIADIPYFIPDNRGGAHYRKKMKNQSDQDNNCQSQKFPM